jgi:ankyrin repeat protein
MDWIALKQSFSKNVREAAKICALGLIMCAYTAPFVPHKHWRYVIEAERQKRNAVHEGADFADFNRKSANGVTPLISAASGNQPNAVIFLLARRADKYARTNEGFTAFDFAAYNTNEAMARRLWIRLSPMRDAALTASGDESRARMNWDICVIRLLRSPEGPLRLSDVSTAFDGKRSSLVYRKQQYRCDQTVHSYVSQLKNPLPSDKTLSMF